MSVGSDSILTCTSILTVFRYQHPITSFGLPHPYFPFSSLAATANTLTSLHLQLMKATVLAESSIYFIFSLRSSDVYRHESGKSRTLPFFLNFFCHFTFLCFSFILIHGINRFTTQLTIKSTSYVLNF
jgi:hypothetical protein